MRWVQWAGIAVLVLFAAFCFYFHWFHLNDRDTFRAAANRQIERMKSEPESRERASKELERFIADEQHYQQLSDTFLKLGIGALVGASILLAVILLLGRRKAGAGSAD